MIFSGFVRVRGCAECDYETARATPTSLFFFLGLAAGGVGLIIPGLTDVFGSRWWYWVTVPIAELVVIFLAMSALLWLRDRIHPFPTSCPRCSGELVPKASGFYDFGCLPTAVELLLLLLFITVHVAIAYSLISSTTQ
jgi:MFS family permease